MMIFSVGAQLDGFHPDYNVKGVKVKGCTFKGTTFGARINPRPADKPTQISNIIFEDLTMDQTVNPIAVKQNYPPAPEKVSLLFSLSIFFYVVVQYHVYFLHRTKAISWHKTYVVKGTM